MSPTTERLPLRDLVLVPGLVTLAFTLLRLTGELLGWAPSLFSREAGGGRALVGIVWLVPLFGAWFARRLAQRSDRPAGGALLLRGAGALVGVVAGVFVVVSVLHPGVVGRFVAFMLLSAAGGLFAYRAWPALGRVLLAYGLAARVPVIIVMLIAILGDWGTHYDVPPPDFPAMNPVLKWIWIGLLPQLLFWVPFTLIVGTLAAGVALLVGGRTKAAAA